MYLSFAGIYEALKNSPGISLYSLGGSYRRTPESFIGPLAVENLKNSRSKLLHRDASFKEAGIFTSEHNEAQSVGGPQDLPAEDHRG